MSILSEFMTFLKNYQVIGLAIAVVIGAAAGKMVTAFVENILMPIIAVLIPGGNWQEYVLAIGPVSLGIGKFASALIDFVIIAAVVFLVVKTIMKADATKKI